MLSVSSWTVCFCFHRISSELTSTDFDWSSFIFDEFVLRFHPTNSSCDFIQRFRPAISCGQPLHRPSPPLAARLRAVTESKWESLKATECNWVRLNATKSHTNSHLEGTQKAPRSHQKPSRSQQEASSKTRQDPAPRIHRELIENSSRTHLEPTWTVCCLDASND